VRHGCTIVVNFKKMASSCDRWVLVSSTFYILGSALFILGSVYVVPGMSTTCISPECSLDVAVWYFVGCLFFFGAAIIDFSLQLLVWRQRDVESRQVGVCLDPVTESLIAAIIYVVGSILFLTGTILFFPSLQLVGTARVVFRAGSVVYIIGSFYGILQLLAPTGCKFSQVRGRSMAQVKTVVPFSDLSSIVDYDPEEDLPQGQGSIEMHTPLKFLNYNVVTGLIVKITFICGSSCFIGGGFLIQEQKVFEGGYLWLGGSFLFVFGSVVSMMRVFVDQKERSSSLKVSSSGTHTTLPQQTEQNCSVSIQDIYTLNAV